MRLALFAVPLIGAVIVLNGREVPSEAAPPDPASGAAIAAPVAVVAPKPRATDAAEISVIPAPTPAGSLRRPGAKGRTLEARAADLVERGSLVEAAALYEDLARQHPDRLVFADAARILRRAARARTLEAR